jgi:periplasmic divalent cation tolerance protein
MCLYLHHPRPSLLLNSRPFPSLASPMERSALVVLTTLGSEAEARELVKALLESRFIACGTLLPGARSLYHWEGSLKEEAEVVVLLKTTVSNWEALVAAIRTLHPYEVPELLALPVDRGLDSYLSWLTSEVVR